MNVFSLKIMAQQLLCTYIVVWRSNITFYWFLTSGQIDYLVYSAIQGTLGPLQIISLTHNALNLPFLLHMYIHAISTNIE